MRLLNGQSSSAYKYVEIKEEYKIIVDKFFDDCKSGAVLYMSRLQCSGLNQTTRRGSNYINIAHSRMLQV